MDTTKLIASGCHSSSLLLGEHQNCHFLCRSVVVADLQPETASNDGDNRPRQRLKPSVKPHRPSPFGKMQWMIEKTKVGGGSRALPEEIGNLSAEAKAFIQKAFEDIDPDLAVWDHHCHIAGTKHR